MSETNPIGANQDAEDSPILEAQPERPQKIYPPEGKVWISYAILGVSIFVYLLQQLSILLLGGDLPATLGAKVNEWIMMGEVWRLLTPVLLHGSILHIGFNMYFLYRIGPNLEKFYGGGRFFALYLATAFTGNVFSFLFTPGASLGASTALFGLVTANAILIYRNQKLFVNPQAALRDIIMTIAVNLMLGMTSGIDNFGHLGGLLGGLAISWFSGPLLALRPEPDGYHIFDRQPQKRFNITVATVVFVFALLAVAKATLF